MPRRFFAQYEADERKQLVLYEIDRAGDAMFSLQYGTNDEEGGEDGHEQGFLWLRKPALRDLRDYLNELLGEEGATTPSANWEDTLKEVT